MDNEQVSETTQEAEPVMSREAAPSQSAAAVASPKKRGWIVAIVALIVVLGLGITGIVSCSNLVFKLWSAAGVVPWDSEETYGPSTIGVIRLEGSMEFDGSASSTSGFTSLLDKAAADNKIKAIVLYVNSGGGYSTVGEEMVEALRKFEKPVVVYCSAICASAAYEVSSQADYIIAAKTSQIGGIGSSLLFEDYSDYYDSQGIRLEYIVSAPSKDATYGNRPLTDEERAHFQAMINEINDVFVAYVAEGRNMTLAKAKSLANGLVYAGNTAKSKGLIDDTGTFDDALAKAAELAQIEAGSYDTVELNDYLYTYYIY
ncbi:MAG: S49 family peptidase [Eggerthellaceae bacterium]|nr:S49 family peptidase [Eggerthellaceae bacterium]